MLIGHSLCSTLEAKAFYGIPPPVKPVVSVTKRTSHASNRSVAGQNRLCNDPLAGHIALGIVDVDNGIDKVLGGDDLVRADGDVVLRRTGERTVLVSISILFSCRHVNRTDDVAGMLREQKDSAPVAKCGVKLYHDLFFFSNRDYEPDAINSIGIPMCILS